MLALEPSLRPAGEVALFMHCSLAWKIPWMEKPGRLQSIGSQSRTRQATSLSFFFSSDAVSSPHGREAPQHLHLFTVTRPAPRTLLAVTGTGVVGVGVEGTRSEQATGASLLATAGRLSHPRSSVTEKGLLAAGRFSDHHLPAPSPGRGGGTHGAPRKETCPAPAPRPLSAGGRRKTA